ncbi:MAG TPA: hypothetical protein VGQ89_09510 [Candidatus Limnocylindrales bacterium]|nr:hypothetical protein [Candidatus Limnocylindrales bacterium]
MNQISLSRAVECDWRLAAQYELQTKRLCDPFDDVERWICPARLDGRDIRTRDSDDIRQLLLGDVEHQARVSTEPRECNSKRRHMGHVPSETGDPYLTLIGMSAVGTKSARTLRGPVPKRQILSISTIDHAGSFEMCVWH